MVDQQALLEALRSFATRSVHDYDLDDALEEVGRQARAVLAVDGAGVTLKVEAGRRPTQYVSATDLSTLRVEREQDALLQGPCLDALAQGRPVAVEDIRATDRWPAYRRVALEAGFRAVAGIPMFGGEVVIGALNCYSRRPRQWSTDELGAARLLANISSAYIATASSYADQTALVRQLQHALSSRILIEQAKGVLAERFGVSTTRAFEALRRHARNQRAKIHNIAADVLTGRQNVEL